MPLAPIDAPNGLPSAAVPAGQPSYLAGLIDAAGQGRALSFVWDRYQQAVQARDGAAFPSFSSVFNGMVNSNGEAVQATIDGLASDLDWFGKVANGTVSPSDPATGLPTDEAIARAFNLATLGITGGLVGTEMRAGGMLLGAGPIRPANPGLSSTLTIFDGEFATQQLLGSSATPAGRQIMFHAADRMVNPPAGRVPMSPAEIDQVLDGATRIVKRSYHPQGNTLTIENSNMPGRPRVIVDEATGSRVITVINPRAK